MKVPTRILKLAEITTEEASRFSIDCIQFRRIDGKAVATATDSRMAIVASWSDGNEKNSDWQNCVKVDAVLLAYSEAKRIDAPYVIVQGPSPNKDDGIAMFAGAIEIRSPSVNKKFPNVNGQDRTTWDVLSDPTATSIKLDPLRLLKLLEVLVTAMDATGNDEMVLKEVILTLSSDDELPLILTADVDDVKIAATLMPISNKGWPDVKPAWNPTSLTKTEADTDLTSPAIPQIYGL